MLDDGEDVTGYVAHTNYVSEMARTGIYQVSALVGYDEEMLELARRGGIGAFHGADTTLTNTKLGVAGTKAARAAYDNYGASRGRGASRSRGRGRGSRSGYDVRDLNGWKRVAAERGICFTYCEGRPCDKNTCAFKHKCVTCDVFGHSMGNCRDKPVDNKS